jgi:DNA-binding transcriptional LysR family regulator
MKQGMTDFTLKHLDLNLLHVFDALRTEGSVSGAAQRLQITQSGASRALGRLRDALGDSLFLPANGGLLLTPYAEQLVDYVRGALDLLSAGIARPEFDPARGVRVFAIAMSDYSEAVLLPPLYRRLAAEAPGIRIDVVAHPRDTSRSLGEGTPDLSIDTAGLDGPRIHARRLLRDELVPVARADHPAFTQAGDAPRACAASCCPAACRASRTGTRSCRASRARSRSGREASSPRSCSRRTPARSRRCRAFWRRRARGARGFTPCRGPAGWGASSSGCTGTSAHTPTRVIAGCATWFARWHPLSS